MKKQNLSTVRNRALMLMQLLRRLEDSSDNGYVGCISCGAILHYKQAQGGHYISRRHRVTELEEDNINPQCPRCNGFLQGNQIAYRHNLIKTIGIERVERLENMFYASQGDEEAMEKLILDDQIKVNTKKTVKDYQEIISYCNTRIKEEKARIGE